MAAVYGIFFAEVAAYRIGTKKLAKLGVNYSKSTRVSYWTRKLMIDSHHEDRTDAHAHAHQDGAHDHDHAHGDREGSPVTETSDISTGPGAGQEKKYQDIENLDSDSDSVRSQAEAAGQLVGVAVLEFGVVLHR
jgi:zinc transporter 1/2/3